jgi:hypothetical protein
MLVSYASSSEERGTHGAVFGAGLRGEFELSDAELRVMEAASWRLWMDRQLVMTLSSVDGLAAGWHLWME